jgi:hypothetical protein
MALAIGTSFVLTPDFGPGAGHPGLCGADDERGQQMPLAARGVLGAPHRLAIQPDRHQLHPIILARAGVCILGSRFGEQATHQPAAHRGAGHLGIGVGDHPPDRRLRRRRRQGCAGPQIQIRQHRRWNILNNRGVTNRSLEAGGDKERSLATKYRKDAERCANE